MKISKLKFIALYKCLLGVMLLTYGPYVFSAEDVIAKPSQYQYPNVWLRAYPEPSKARVLSIVRIVDEPKSEAQTVATQDVIMQVTKWKVKNGKRNGEDYAIGFFSGKNYGLYHPFLRSMRKQGKKIENDFQAAGTATGLKLGDGTWIRSFGYLGGRLYNGLPLINGAIGREVDWTDPNRVDWSEDPLWAKFVAMRVHGRCCADFIWSVFNLGDGTVLAVGGQFVVRLNIKDGSLPVKHKDIRILDYATVKAFVEKSLEEGERAGIVQMNDGRTMMPYLEQKSLQEFFKQ